MMMIMMIMMVMMNMMIVVWRVFVFVSFSVFFLFLHFANCFVELNSTIEVVSRAAEDKRFGCFGPLNNSKASIL